MGVGSIAVPLHPAFAFGKFGHQLAGEIGELYLCETAKQEYRRLNDPYPFASAGAWADAVRYQKGFSQTRPWHYINVEGERFNRDVRRSSDGDVLWAIYYNRQRLVDQSLSKEERQQALLYLIHFVVDLHQPLHVGYSSDRGGNSVKVRLDGRKTNLHSVWDTGLLGLEGQALPDYVAALRELSLGNEGLWQSTGPETWLQESLDLRPAVYSFRSAPTTAILTLREPYLSESKEIVDVRLAQAGVRLAGVLNDIWCLGGSEDGAGAGAEPVAAPE